MKIVTDYWPKPIPLRCYDWTAIDHDSYDGAIDSLTRHQIGFGATEAKAIADLKEKLDHNLTTNWNCDGSGPHTEGEVRVYPLGAGGNLILCHHCWANENRFRYGKHDAENWPQINWYQAEVYGSRQTDDDYERAAEDEQRKRDAREGFES